MDKELVNNYCQKWSLSSPQRIASTFTSEVFKVIFKGQPAVLKLLNEKGRQFEAKGAAVLRCFNGNGAVRLHQADDGAHLLEFVDGILLKILVEQGEDERATQIICDLIRKLHTYAGSIPTELISMERNFRSLFSKAKSEKGDSIYIAGSKVAAKLISNARDIRVLHGDIHHENILESSNRGWLIIDPQCLAGERTYDLANVFYNPNGFLEHTTSPNLIERRCDQFSRELHLDKRRILEYAFAYGCLSATWCIEDGQSPEDTLAIARVIQAMI